MRVLEEVNIEKKHKCKYCKSIFTYQEYNIDRAWGKRVRCPVCKQNVPVSIFDKKVEE